MTASFATPTDLATRLGRTVWSAGAVLDQVSEFLEDASAHLREIIGWQVYPPAEITQTVWDCGQLLDLELPGSPVSAVGSVTVNGVLQSPSSYELVNGSLRRVGGYGGYPGFEYSHHNRQWVGKVVVTYTVGYATPPRDLVSWTCVLASQAMAVAGATGALGTTPTRSKTIGTPGGGTYATTMDTTGDNSPFLLPPRVEDALRRRYGGGAYVTGSSR